MQVKNIHTRTISRPLPEVAELLASLASADDRLWPHEHWPAMRMDRGLACGARGGHGPIRYTVAEYRPGESIAFRFSAPAGFNGGHGFRLSPASQESTVLSHTLEMRAAGPAILSWPLVFRPLHDALIEDAFDKAEKNLGLVPASRTWTLQVKILRRLLRAIRRRKR